MYCNRLRAWLSTHSWLAILLSSLIARWWVGLQTLWRFWLKDLAIDEMVGACFGCCHAHLGLPVGYHLLRYSVLSTVESLSLLYLLFKSCFICSRRWCIDELGSFMQTKHIDLIHIWTKGEVGAPWNQLKPSSKIFLLTVPRRYFFCGSFMIFLSCFCYAFVRICLLMPCGHLLGKGWPLGSRLWCLIVKLSLSHWYPGSGVVLDCIDSWSLPSFLLSKQTIVHLAQFSVLFLVTFCRWQVS